MSDLGKSIVEKLGFEVTNSWFDIAYGDRTDAVDERDKALEAFAKG